MTDQTKIGWVHRGPLGHGNLITSLDGRQIAVTYGPNVNKRSAQDTALIAAAPEMLEVLKAIVTACDQPYSPSNPEVDGAFALERARAVIALAEGRIGDGRTHEEVPK